MILREFRDTDAERIATLLNNKKIWNNLRDYIPHPYSMDDAREFISLCQSENPQKTFIIDDEGSAIGVIGLVLQKDVYRKSAELGYWLGEPFWNNGYSTQAVRNIVAYGFNTLDLVRIYAGVFEHNKASRRVLEKAGFVLEGILRRSIIKNDKILDEHLYAILNKKFNQ